MEKKQRKKEFKRCPRCGLKMGKDFQTCGKCGLDFKKFDSATNAEAKKAFRSHEKERVLNTSVLPKDVNRVKLLLLCIFLGMFGGHYYYIGRYYRGALNLVSCIGYFLLYFMSGKWSGYIYNSFLTIFACLFAILFVLWAGEIFLIVFKKFKVPVSLPYTK